MKTTLNLPDDLVRTIKLRAVYSNRTLQDTIAELLRLGLAHSETQPSDIRRRVNLPLIRAGQPKQHLSPTDLANILAEQEFRDLS